MRILAAPLLVFLALTIPAVAEPACTPLFGDFVAAAEPACLESAVLFCTRGTLTGDLDGAYDFVMTSQAPAPALAHPTRLVFTGESVITLADGRMFAQDTGRMDVSAGPWPFETIVNINGGEGAWEGARGQLVATGALHLDEGVTKGTYEGYVCV
jgi:hypothetical protein